MPEGVSEGRVVKLNPFLPDTLPVFSFPMRFHPIKKTKNYFIESQGRIFKTVNGKDEDVPILKAKRTGRLYVMIDGKQKDYLYLMIEYFKPEIKATDNIRYKVNSEGRITDCSIIIKPFTSQTLSKEDQTLEYKYMCGIKANAANARNKGIVTSFQVLTCLKMNNFKCVYCQDSIVPEDWHLDHFYPLAKEGKNEFRNIVPSCPTCNFMKGAIYPERFYSFCAKVAVNYAFKQQAIDLALAGEYKDGKMCDILLIDKIHKTLSEGVLIQ